MLEVNSIDAFYGEFQVLKNVSMRVGNGELHILLGPNGHGRSTLLKTICGLMQPTAGSIYFEGQPIHRLACEKIVEMGITYIAEDRELFPQMTVLENLKMGAHNRNARASEKESLEYVLELFPRLTERIKSFASNLSGGEARMLSVHKMRDVPQFISTNRHVMQGYLDLLDMPEWKKDEGVLEGVSAVVAKDPYELVIACNGRIPASVDVSNGEGKLGWKDQQKGIAVLNLQTAENANVRWKVRFD